MAVLGSLYRHGELTVGELATLERVQPPSMTRTITCLEEAGHVARRRHDTDGRQVVVALTETGTHDRRRRPPQPRRLARPPALRPHPSRTRRPPRGGPDPRKALHYVSPTFRSLRNPNYRRYAAGGMVSNTGTWMQRVAQDWLVLQLTANSGAAIGITTGLQFLPFLLLSPFAGVVADRIPKRRLLQLTNLGMAAARPRARPARRHRHRPDLARLRARARPRRRLRVRRPGPAELRLRDRRRRRPDQRGRPQLRQLQRRPPGGSGRGRRADRRARRGRGRHRLGDPGQRGQLRRADPHPALARRAHAPHARAGTAGAGTDPGRRPATCSAGPT